MIKLFEFFKQQKPKPLEMPKVGDIYQLKNENPFDRIKIIIIDVKENWVKYAYLKDNGKPREWFGASTDDWKILRHIYTKV